jgi:hypothetical protein
MLEISKIKYRIMKKLSTILAMTGLIFLSSTQVSCAQTEKNVKSAEDFIASIDWAASPPPTGMITFRLDCKDGPVELTNNGNAEVKAGTLVKWTITCGSIKSIQIVPGSKGFSTHSDIWEVKPYPLGGNPEAKSWIGDTKILTDEDDDILYGFYNVIWFDENNTPHVIDPLIKVNK